MIRGAATGFAWRAAAPVFCILYSVFSFASADAPELLRTDSRAPYVHRITLYDHDGVAISPTDEPAKPYSPRATCGKCHNYAEISHGWHFNASDANTLPGRPGEPWFLVDEKTGGVQAISGRGWPGTQKPADAGLTNWRFVKRFGHHLPGGGFGEPPDEVIKKSPERVRWGISGKLEIDCMVCHAADQQHDPTEAARQIEKENFRWIPTLALGLGVLRGEARRLPDDWDPDLPASPDYPDRKAPELIYDKMRFDADDRVLFSITRRVPNERCYFCHTPRIVGELAPDAWETDQDVHLAAGLLCVDCHRHGEDHMITRGYDGEACKMLEPAKASLSCRGCHLGLADAGSMAAALGGRLRAPFPEHEGFPPLHFEKLSCTVCHSGPWPHATTVPVQTAAAHGLGIATRDRTATTPPLIAAPAFVRQDNEVIVPMRLTAPAGAAEPAAHLAWPLAHDVRPAAQALGIGGCTDCHATDAPLFAGDVQVGDRHWRMSALIDYDAALANMWGIGFRFRPAFKVFGFLCAAVVALILARSMLDVFYHTVLGADVAAGLSTGRDVAAGLSTGRRSPAETRATLGGVGLTRWEHIAHAVAVAGVLVQAATAFGSKLLGSELDGWVLMAHMAGAGLFILGLTETALLWAARCRLGSASGLTAVQKWMFWLALAAGFAVMLPMLLAMLPVFGTDGQEELVEFHGAAAIVLLIVMVLHTLVSLRARWVRGKRA